MKTKVLFFLLILFGMGGSLLAGEHDFTLYPPRIPEPRVEEAEPINLVPPIFAQTNTFCAANLACTITGIWSFATPLASLAVSGTTTLSGSTGIGLLNNQLTVGPAGFRYTTIAGAIASSDCPAVGCTIFVRPDVTMDATTIAVTKPVHIVFDCASYTYSGTGSMFSSTTGVEGIRINGCGRSTQAFNIGTVLNITNTSAIGFNMTNSPSLDLEYFTLKGPGSGTGKGIVIGGTRPGVYKVLVDGFGTDGITIDGSVQNTNVGTFIHTRSSHMGGHGWVVSGVNANLEVFVNCDASNDIDGFRIASSFNLFLGTDTNSNTNGYHFLSGASVNRGFIYSDGTDTLGVLLDAGAVGNILQFDDSTTTVTDNGSGNRYQGIGSTPSWWNSLDAQSFNSATSNIASSGLIRGAAADTWCWRNNANSANVCLSRAGASDSLSWPNSINAGANLNGNTVNVTAAPSGSASSTSGGYDSTTGTEQHNSNNNGASSFSGAWNCTNVTPVTVNANVATDQNMMACTIPAGTLNRVGRTLRVKVAGVYSTPAASTSAMTLKIKLCTVGGCGSGTVISPINIQSTALGTVQITNDNFSARSELTTQTAGASSAYEAHGEYLIDLATLATAADNVFGDGNTATVGTIDSTAQLFLQVTFAFSNASASNSATQRQLIAETVN